ncbi:Uma2 family endonuclease [Tunicatimonas pelagia]|uniref:Uma2 family endonuclease n=1 Tax=Tunicatimonas pelagia TaxID=931531 RepID=UPI0026654727|nr:Uma2 family endonuclease [Tunicatimonas pelagia]WKN40756.1 Uma2 family endonuclease [Tunicatimonas pelagia]
MIPVPVRHRFSVDDLLLMEESGVLSPDQRIELIDGEIIDISPINQPHAACVRKLIRFFQQHLPLDQYILDAQNPLQLTEHTLPQPDLIIAHYRSELLTEEHIQPTDVTLLIEVSDATYSYDRNKKYAQYASAGIPIYWIVNLNKQRVEVYSQPEGNQYLREEIHQKAFNVLEGITISPSDIFPKKG